MLDQLLPKLRAYRAVILRRWWLWVLAMALAGGAAWVMQSSKPTLYTVRTSFVPEAGTGVANPLAALMAGGAVGGGGGNDMMIGVIMSARIRKAIAADTLMLSGKAEPTASAFLRLCPPQKSLAQQLGIAPVKPIVDTIDYAVQMMNGSFVAKIDKYGYIEVFVTVQDRALAPAVTNALIKHMSLYYRDQKTEKARYSLDYFNRKIDTVVAQLDAATLTNAHYLDRYKFSPYAESFIPREKVMKKADYLQTVYSQLLVSREQAVAQLLDETPVIQVLDFPEQVKIVRPKITSIILLACFGAIVLVMIINAWPQFRADISAYLATLLTQPEA